MQPPLTPDQANQIADAIRDHYKPVGPSDSVPTAPVSVAVALADKLDTLTGFFAIDEIPTGSKDPYALRRATLGTIRTILEGRYRVGIRTLIHSAMADAYVGYELRRYPSMRVTQNFFAQAGMSAEAAACWVDRVDAVTQRDMTLDDHALSELAERRSQFLAFFADRLKVLLRDQGKRHDLVDAVFALGDDDLVRIVARIEALDAFLKTDDGANLLAGYRRAANILKAEEKKGPLPTGEAQSLPGAPDEETLLLTCLRVALPDLKIELQNEQFTEALGTLAQLRAPVDAFFDKVLVNAEDVATRQNRLRLLAQVRDAMGLVADFSLISG